MGAGRRGSPCAASNRSRELATGNWILATEDWGRTVPSLVVSRRLEHVYKGVEGRNAT